MKIIELRASNFARLRAVSIRPNGALVPITGKNGQGKTSVLKAIWTALVGRAVAPPKPIREGAEKAVISLDLGDLEITRTFSRSKHGEITSSLAVTEPVEDPLTKHARQRIARAPQALIDALLGDLSFDPLAFSKLKPNEQFERLKALVPNVDFDKIAQEREEHYDARTSANRAKKEADARAAGVMLPPGDPPKAVDMDKLRAKHAKQLETYNRQQRTILEIEQSKATAQRMFDEAEELRSRAAQLDEKASADMRHAEARSAAVGQLVSMEAITSEMESAQRANDARRLFDQRSYYEQEAGNFAAESDEHTKAIAALDDAVRVAISKAKLPAGLSLDIETQTVLLQKLPFESAGTADKIIASAQAAMALNPTLRVMLIDEGSELDSDHLEMLSELAEANEHQIWIARVEEGEGGVGFRIEDGNVAAAQEAAE